MRKIFVLVVFSATSLLLTHKRTMMLVMIQFDWKRNSSVSLVFYLVVKFPTKNSSRFASHAYPRNTPTIENIHWCIDYSISSMGKSYFRWISKEKTAVIDENLSEWSKSIQKRNSASYRKSLSQSLANNRRWNKINILTCFTRESLSCMYSILIKRKNLFVCLLKKLFNEEYFQSNWKSEVLSLGKTNDEQAIIKKSLQVRVDF